MPDHPDQFGYYDPVLFLHNNIVSISEARVRVAADGLNVRMGPQVEYPRLAQVNTAQEFTALRKRNEATTNCVGGWYQIRPTDGSRIVATLFGGEVPDGWVCADFVSLVDQILLVSLTANPSSGTAPLGTNLTADVSGTASGTINYTFWWNCSDPGTSVEEVMAICGGIPTPDLGTCAENENGEKCNAVTDDPKTVNHTYQSAGTYTAKVIAERGSAHPAEDRVTITVNATTTATHTPTPTKTPTTPTPTGTATPTGTPTAASWHSSSANGKYDSGWDNPENTYNSDNQYAVASGWYETHDWYNFGFNIPPESMIDGIEIKLEGTGDGIDYVGKVKVGVRWNGFFFDETDYLEFPATEEAIHTVGGPSDLWGRSFWSPEDFEDDADRPFVVRLTTGPDWHTCRLDNIQVKVHYTTPTARPHLLIHQQQRRPRHSRRHTRQRLHRPGRRRIHPRQRLLTLRHQLRHPRQPTHRPTRPRTPRRKHQWSRTHQRRR